MRKPSYTTLQAKADHYQQEYHKAMRGLRAVSLKATSESYQAQDDGWHYWIRAYDLASPCGGILVIRAKCLTNKQADSIIVEYLDNAAERFPYAQTPNVAGVINQIKIHRSQLAA